MNITTIRLLVEMMVIMYICDTMGDIPHYIHITRLRLRGIKGISYKRFFQKEDTCPSMFVWGGLGEGTGGGGRCGVFHLLPSRMLCKLPSVFLIVNR